MTVYICLKDQEKNKLTSNQRLNDLLAFVNKTTGEEFQLIEVETKIINFLPKMFLNTTKKYELLIKTCVGDYKIVDFIYKKSHLLDADFLVSYFYGVLAGKGHLDVCNKP